MACSFAKMTISTRIRVLHSKCILLILIGLRKQSLICRYKCGFIAWFFISISALSSFVKLERIRKSELNLWSFWIRALSGKLAARYWCIDRRNGALNIPLFVTSRRFKFKRNDYYELGFRSTNRWTNFSYYCLAAFSIGILHYAIHVSRYCNHPTEMYNHCWRDLKQKCSARFQQKAYPS